MYTQGSEKQDYRDMFSDYPDVLNISDLQNALDIGRTSAYRLVRGGQVRHLRIGKSIKIPRR